MEIYAVYRTCQLTDPDRVTYRNVGTDISDAELVLAAAKVCGKDISNYYHYTVARGDDGLVKVTLSKD